MGRLLCYLNGVPDVESLYPVLARLNARQNLDLTVKIHNKTVANEPRLNDTFKAHNFHPTLASKLAMKLFFAKDYKSADAVLTLNDPVWEQTSRAQRSRYQARHNIPSIFVQHGVYQLGVNAPRGSKPMDYRSERLIFWEDVAPNSELFTAQTRSRICVAGFTKAPLFDTTQIQSEWGQTRAKYRRTVLICQSFRWSGDRFDETSIAEFYDLLTQFLTQNPDILVILRGHRGKKRKNHASLDQKLIARFDNVIMSDHHSGPLKGATIQDVLSICDCMISPLSTTILDAAYLNKPVAILDKTDNPLNLAPSLPRLQTAEDLSGFVNRDPENTQDIAALRTHYGNLADNIEKACTLIEDFVNAPK